MQVHSQRRVVVLRVEFKDEVRTRNPCAVDQHVNSTEPANSLRSGLTECDAIGQIHPGYRLVGLDVEDDHRHQRLEVLEIAKPTCHRATGHDTEAGDVAKPGDC